MSLMRSSCSVEFRLAELRLLDERDVTPGLSFASPVSLGRGLWLRLPPPLDGVNVPPPAPAALLNPGELPADNSSKQTRSHLYNNVTNTCTQYVGFKEKEEF